MASNICRWKSCTFLSSFSHNPLHQVTEGTGSLPVSYTWDVHGNLARRTGGFYGDASFTHDELDRLVRVSQGGATTDLVLDPLGRLVGKVRQTGEGSVAKVYLQDGEQVVVEYGKGVGSSSWRAQRRHLWGRWIDELAVEQVDMDGDGVLETSLWPVTDLLGTVELLTDGAGAVVERFSYDPEGRPQVWSADTQRPKVTRVAWTGDGSDGRCPAGIPALPCPPGAFQLGFGEELHAASAAGATATLTPQGGQPVPLTVTLTPDGRAAYLTGATLQAGTSYSLQLEGLRDRAGNLLWQWGAHTGAPLLTFTLTDPTVFQVLEDTAPPRLLAALDAADGLYLAWEEPVEVASGFNLDTSIAVLRQGQLVAGRVTRLSPQLFRWQPAEASQWLVGAEYTLSAVHLQDLSGKAATAPSLSFTHMAASSQVAYLVYQAPGDSQPQARSSYGLTTLFQGRSWHEELGLYHYRARWYSPELGDFLQRDPLGYLDSPNLYQFLNRNPVNFLDPLGEWFIVAEVWSENTAPKNLRARAKVSLYANDGSRILGPIDALATGQHNQRTRIAGDTPYGVYVTVGGVFEEVVPYRNLSKYSPAGLAVRSIDYFTKREASEEEGLRKAKSFGLGTILMQPLYLESGADGVRRDIIIHGGGTGLFKDTARLPTDAKNDLLTRTKYRDPFVPNVGPWEPDQPLTPTEGCLRLTNDGILHLIEMIKSLPSISTGGPEDRDRKDGVIAVGDSDFLRGLANDAELVRRWNFSGVKKKTGLSVEKFVTVLKGKYGGAP
jgi:RHS repeat-associated protein